MKRTNQLIFILIILIIALGSAIYFRSYDSQQEQISPPVEPQNQQPIKKPIVHYPIPEPAAVAQHEELPQNVAETDQQTSAENIDPALPETLPKMENSDQSIKQSLGTFFTEKSVPKIFLTENFIQRFVATIDNLPEKKLPRTLLPLQPPKGKFIVSGTVEEPQTSSRNNERYAPYVAIMGKITPEGAVKIYTYFYPLFQKAYEQLGYKNAYFNDRLVFVLEHLLETPNPADPISLTQPVVLYTYADPTYENMSAGQKLLLRIGQENRTAVLEILEKYRTLLTRQSP